MKAIPKKLLIHKVVLHKKEKEDKWGNATLDAGTELSYVRMEPSKQIVRDKNNAEIQLSATLFFDCRNSRPKDITFQTDDIIVFNGMKHQVKVVEPLYDEKILHHYELGLIKSA
ncbi:putative minor capsid protein [Anaerostipes butyraticus]|uniref:Minor capsid protein n=1 Tax=Anaerostipes butyraticus TaxID=645466 RepID=A0A916VF62_9FIRM|nr:putative minor capsid protein [Anaerostipes butyraticus]GFO86497.1 hypothetical protein ANBU17_28440 [Anaerostipes butyraticus]